jgi:hypothetical protein
MKNWMMPPQTSSAVLASLKVQASRHIEAEEPDEKELERVLKIIEQTYPHTRYPESLGETINWTALRQELIHILDHDVNLGASPGMPFKNTFSDINKLRVEELNTLITLTFRRIQTLLKTNLDDMTSSELVLQGACDPVFLFVKGEPHPLRKIKTQTWRLISSVSVVDQLIDRLLHSTQNNLEIGLWQYIPSKPGIGFTRKGCDSLRKDLHAKAGQGEFAQADVQGWDWSIQGWELRLETEARIRLMRSQGTVAATLMRARTHCLNNPVYANSDGSMYTQDYEGVMKSGTYCTSSSNSRIRVMVSLLIGARWCIAMGDDSIEDPVPDAQSKYLLLGHPLREYSRRKGDFEFCSRNFFTDGTSLPSDPTKSLYALASSKITLDRLEAYVEHVKDHPAREVHLAALRNDLMLDITPEAYEFLQTWQ